MIMANLSGVQKLVDRLQKLAAKTGKTKSPSVAVGYSAAYALYVHESIEMKLKGQKRRGARGKGMYWDPQDRAQAKFLEQPARELRPELRRIIALAAKRGATLAEALLLAGMRLQGESMKLVPVDTGALKASAYTKLEKT